MSSRVFRDYTRQAVVARCVADVLILKDFCFIQTARPRRLVWGLVGYILLRNKFSKKKKNILEFLLTTWKTAIYLLLLC